MPLSTNLTGQRDARGMQGIFSRGKAVYNGGTSAAHSGGGPQFGRPRKPVSPGAKAGGAAPQVVEGNNNPYMAAIRRRLMRGPSGTHA